MKTLICRILFMGCFGGVGHLIFNTNMYAEAFILAIVCLVVVSYDAVTDKPKVKEDGK